MSKFLFSLHNVLLYSELGSVDMDDTEYSLMYDVHEIQGRKVVMIDVNSVKRQVWADRKATWVTARVDAPIIVKIEELIQEQIEREEFEDSVEMKQSAQEAVA